MPSERNKIKGRGAVTNPPNRFVPIEYVPEEGAEPAEVTTQLFRDASRSLISYNKSPDVGFDASINIYRGCEHGCAYCYARATHEYLGLSAGLDFETKIFVKTDAPEILRKELSSKRWHPQVVAVSGNSDAYQPLEKRFQLTRQCLSVFAEFRNPVVIITKNQLITRDLDILTELNRFRAVKVFISLTSLSASLCAVLEPRTSRPPKRLETIATLRQADIPCGVLVAPVIPGLNDHEIPAILKAAADAGAQYARYILLRLPHSVAPVFVHWLEANFPQRKEKILNRIKDLRSGRLYDSRFGIRQQGEGKYAQQIADLFALSCRKNHLHRKSAFLETKHFRVPGSPSQLSLFQK